MTNWPTPQYTIVKASAKKDVPYSNPYWYRHHEITIPTQSQTCKVTSLHDEGEVDLGVADLDINLELAFTLGLRLLE